MDTLLLSYLSKGFDDQAGDLTGAHRPVVTISREYGCPSKLIGQMLADQLNRHFSVEKDPKWVVINKEILEESARELKISEPQIKSMLDSEKKGVVVDLLSFSTTYGGGERVKRTVQQIIRNIASRGRVVIIGRGGAVILRSHPDSLHIRLEAPLEWRIAEIVKVQGIPPHEAARIAADTDAKRTRLLENLLGNKPGPYLFDVTFNLKYLSKEEIVQSLIALMLKRKMA